MLDGTDKENTKYATKKWYVIDSESKGSYSHHDPKKFLTKSIESSLCGYADAYILVTGDIVVTRTVAAIASDNPDPLQKKKKKTLAAATQVAFKDCAPFENCTTEIDGTFVDKVNFINITMPMYNLIEYRENYSDTSGSL